MQPTFFRPISDPRNGADSSAYAMSGKGGQTVIFYTGVLAWSSVWAHGWSSRR